MKFDQYFILNLMHHYSSIYTLYIWEWYFIFGSGLLYLVESDRWSVKVGVLHCRDHCIITLIVSYFMMYVCQGCHEAFFNHGS